MSATPDSTRCKHAPCRCTVEQGLAYCCEYCARADQQPATGQEHKVCECGHPECRQKRDQAFTRSLAFLASDADSSFITGIVLHVAGGEIAGQGERGYS